MSGFMHVRFIHVPDQLVQAAHTHLQRVGRQGLEGFALWSGILDGERFLVRATYIPAQQGLRLDSGVCVTVDGDELHRINVWLYTHQFRLIAQLHSHPGEAYHSKTDDAFPIATTVGSLSLVIPYFARAPFSLSRCAIYRLSPQAQWLTLPPAEAAQLIMIEE